MSYRLVFLASAMREWKKLDPDIRKQFKTKLIARLEAPRVERDRLSVMKDCYKIKLRSVGYRLVYQVRERDIAVAVGGRRQTRAQYRLSGGNKKDLVRISHSYGSPAMITYKGYAATVEFDDSVGRLHGRVVNSDSCPIATFEATDSDDLKAEFQRSIDEYLLSCQEDGIEPQRPFPRKLNVT